MCRPVLDNDERHGEATKVTLQSFTYHLDGVYYPLRDDIDSLTTHLNALQQEIDTIQRLLDFQAEPLPSIDRWTRPSIDNDYTRS
ncbi:hypothetical protein HID58_074475 [Brassica napus]|uniref:LOB domain-containing protein n=1 Tax=Brassica napus TaxID=3708 RepID=A0ABQ7YGX5_BRANA|nr:hypothetical protein HID58_074475 [Brassica napus]